MFAGHIGVIREDVCIGGLLIGSINEPKYRLRTERCLAGRFSDDHDPQLFVRLDNGTIYYTGM